MTERPEQLQASSDNLPPTEPIALPEPRHRTLDVPLPSARTRAREERISELVREAVDRGVPTTDPTLGLTVHPPHRARRARRLAERRSEHALGLALVLAAHGALGALVGVAGTLAALALGGAL